MLMLNNINIGYRFAAALLLPIVGFLLWSGYSIHEKQQVVIEMQQLSGLSNLTVRISALVHELQRERGASAVFLGSKGAELKDEVQAQRKRTSEQREKLKEAVKQVDMSLLDNVAKQSLQESLALLNKLDNEREKISSLAIPAVESSAYFTKTNLRFLGLAESMTNLSKDIRISRIIAAYANFMQAKERAGQERASAAPAFAAGHFTHAFYRAFLTAVSSQGTYFKVFTSRATSEQLKFMQETVIGQEVNEVERIRKLVLEKGVDADIQSISGSYWYKVTTARIDLLKKVEDYLSQDLQRATEQTIRMAKMSFQQTLVIMLSLFIVTVLFGVIIVLSVTRPLARITKVAAQMAKGNMEIEVVDSQRGDEVGNVAKAFTTLIDANKRAQNNLDELINAARKGQLNRTININGLEGSFKQMAESMNGLMHTFSEQIQKSIVILKAISQGDLSQNMEGDYEGMFHEMQGSINNSIFAIRQIQENTVNLIDFANQGQLDHRIDSTQFQGQFATLATDMNHLMDTIITPISTAIMVLENLVEGNLTKQMEGHYEGSFGQMQVALNQTIEHLRSTVERIKTASISVDTASNEIATGSSDLAKRTETQAANLEETAAAMEQLTATVNANTQNTINANTLSGNARHIAEKGGMVVEEAVLAMSNIEKSSQKISNIIRVIDEIAFQTNLLALNAAVEAARAGDAGKGFAVVASEVRTLAGRSAEASKEIKELINESAKEVKSGAKLVNQAGETLQEIVSSVKQVADIVSEIASATAEQSSGINEINLAITQTDDAIQKNAVLVEKNSAAVQSLVNQASNLTQMMQFFTTNERFIESAADN